MTSMFMEDLCLDWIQLAFLSTSVLAEMTLINSFQD